MATHNPAAPGRPFLKWAGGKRSIAKEIIALFPADARGRTYREPFVGGGAIFFALQPKKAILTDILEPLIGCYAAVAKELDELIKVLSSLSRSHNKEKFYAVREAFNLGKGSRVERAAWLIYMNRTGYNGLYRTNAKGKLNVPLGSYKSPRILDVDRLSACSAALKKSTLRCASFDDALRDAKAGDLIYLDPPYVPLSKTSNFEAYAAGGFGPDQQTHLAEVFRRLDRKGCLLVQSNSDAPLVRSLYKDFMIEPIQVARPINSQAAGRGRVQELVIRNFR